ncbi:MAG: dihydroneopterin aldolase [Prevotella sp.]
MNCSYGYIILKDIRFYARHGAIAQERETGGEFNVSVRVKYPLEKSVISDNLNDTLNYAELFEIINKEMQQPSFLLEHVAGRIGQSIFNKMPKTESIDITVSKINPPIGADIACASVELHLIGEKPDNLSKF